MARVLSCNIRGELQGIGRASALRWASGLLHPARVLPRNELEVGRLVTLSTTTPAPYG